MINLNGQKLKKSDVDGILNPLTHPSVLIKTDMVGFKFFIEGYPGWFQPPAVSVDSVFMSGAHPSGIGLLVVGSKATLNMQIYENIDTPSMVEEIVNYT